MRKMVSALLTLLLLLSLSACGGKSETAAPAAQADAPKAADAPAPAADTPAGFYKMTGLVSDGEETDMSELAELGMVFYLVLNEDGTGYMDMMDGDQDMFRWDDTSLTDDDGSTIAYTYSDGVITLAEGDDTMTFTRLSGEELAHYKEFGSGSLEDLFAGGETFEKAGAVGDYYVEFVGAETLTSEQGAPAIRIWYDFTNNSDKVAAPAFALMRGARQGEEELWGAYLLDDVPESENGAYGVAPGCTVRCAELYEYDPEAGTVTAYAGSLFGSTVTLDYDLNALSGAPAEADYAAGASAVPAYLDGVPDKDDSVEILGVETGVNDDGENIVTVRFRFTNNDDDAACLSSVYNIFVMQDGYGLRQTYTGTEEERNADKDIRPGETVECAAAYVLRTGDPVAIVLDEYLGDGYFGRVFELSVN